MLSFFQDKTIPFSLSKTSASNVLLVSLTILDASSSYKLEITHRRPEAEKPCLRDVICLKEASPADLDVAITEFFLKDK